MSRLVMQNVKILDFMLGKSKEVWNSRKNKILGYGVKSVDFDHKRHQLTRRIFRTYKQQLLDDKLIIQLQTSDNRAKVYSITPLGICYLIKKKGYGTPIEQIKKIFDILGTFYENKHVKIKSSIFPSKKFDFTEIKNELEKNEKYVVYGVLNKFFGRLITYTKPMFETNQNSVIIKYLTSYNLEAIIAFFNIDEDAITLLESPSTSKQLRLSSELNDNEFHTYLSMYLLYGICYHTIKEHFDEFMSNRILRSVNDFKYSDEIEELEKTKQYDKKYIELVLLVQGHICDNLSTVLNHQKYYSEKLNQYCYDIEPKEKKIYMFEKRITTEMLI